MNLTKIILLLSILIYLTISNLSAQQNVSAGVDLDWIKSIGGVGFQTPEAMTRDRYGNVYIAGVFDGTVDFDPGPKEYLLTCSGLYDGFVVKLDATGRFKWAKRLGGSGNDQVLAIAVDNDENVYTTGFFTGTTDLDPGDGVFSLTASGGEDAFVSKLDKRGNFLWAVKIGGTDHDRGLAITVDSLKQVYIAGSFTGSVDFDPGLGVFNLVSASSSKDIFVCKLNVSGGFVWAIKQGSFGSDIAFNISLDANGNIVTSGQFNYKVDFDPGVDTFFLSNSGNSSGIFLCKLTQSGDFLWAKKLSGTGGGKPCNKIYVDANDTIYVSGFFSGVVDFDPGNDTFNLSSVGGKDIFFGKYDFNGNLVWAKSIGGNQDDEAISMAVDNKGAIYITGFSSGVLDVNPSQQVSNLFLSSSRDIIIFKIDTRGNFKWAVGAGNSAEVDVGKTIDIDNINNVYITGYFSKAANFGMGKGSLPVSTVDFIVGNSSKQDVFLLKLKQCGVSGMIFNDINQNCSFDTIEIGIEGRNVLINPGSYITQTNALGIWATDILSPGNYTAIADTSGKWKGACGSTSSFTVTHPDSTVVAPSIGLYNTQPCAQPEISIHMPRLRRCFNDNLIYVKACNQIFASGALNDAYAEIQLDTLLTVMSASLPFTQIGNNTYRFELDTLYPGFCKDFTITAAVSCASVLEQTLCMKAKIFPIAQCLIDTTQPRYCPDASTTCNTNFEGSNVVVKARCVNDSIYLSVKNENPVGNNNMNCPLPVNIFRDGELIQTQQVQLNGGDSINYKFLGDGRTWRIGSTQHPKHPRQGCPNATIEACGDSTNWTPGLVNILPVNEVQKIEATYCGIVIGSYDPNDKTGFPLGVTANHFIAPNQDLEYLIRFQNTGNDTAFTVIIRDTLDSDFDIFTVRSGVASHEYDFRMYEQHILEWTFNNILLPDSATNELASNGFVKFTVQQNKDLPDGTEFNNRVGIYFDYNDPIITNTTSHIINRNTFKVVQSGGVLGSERAFILAYPNPVSGNLHLKGISACCTAYELEVTDVMGKVVAKQTQGTADEVILNFSHLAKGLYFIQLSHRSGREVLRVVKE